MKNLKEYTKSELINIAEQLTIPKAGLSNSKNSTLITKIEDMAEELAVSVPSPEIIVDMPVKTVVDGKEEKGQECWYSGPDDVGIGSSHPGTDRKPHQERCKDVFEERIGRLPGGVDVGLG